MTEFDQDDVNAKNDESLRMLARSLTLSQGQFSLILAHCNYRSLRQRLMEQLRERCPIEFRERVLDPSAKTIETTIQEELRDEPPQPSSSLAWNRCATLMQYYLQPTKHGMSFAKISRSR
jgi:hypothetical protein